MTGPTDDPVRSAPRIVIVCSLSLFIIFGIRLSFSVFFAEFVLVEGWSNEAAAAIFSLNMLAFSLTAPLAGIALDRYGPRPVFGVGVCLMAAGLWLSGQATTLQRHVSVLRSYRGLRLGHHRLGTGGIGGGGLDDPGHNAVALSASPLPVRDWGPWYLCPWRTS